MQKIVTKVKDGMPDYIDKVWKEKLPPSSKTYDQEDRLSLLAPVDKELDPKVQHVPYKLKQNCVGVAYPSTNINRDIGSQSNRDTSSPQTNRNIGSP